MKITKLGHCCIVIEEGGVRVLTDPGTYSTLQNKVKNIDAILITHEHEDHIHLDSLKTVLQNNPNAKIFTNKGVGKILARENIQFELLEDGQQKTIEDVRIEGFGKKHKEAYPTMPIVDNTGYFIANTFFYPGDAFTTPGKQVEILALPVVGTWLRLAEAIDYAKELHPRICLPVHDGMLKIPGPFHGFPPTVLGPLGIEFRVFEEGQRQRV